MRKIATLITTLTFSISVLAISPASTAQTIQLSVASSTSAIAIARPATFDLGVQSTSPNADLYSVSCPSAGNCVAAGFVKTAAGPQEAFTQTQINGTWTNGTLATFDEGVQFETPDSYFYSISCSSAGNCVAAGSFRNLALGREAFTQTQTNGVWANAVPATFGVGLQHANRNDVFNSVSCASAGNCVAVGEFHNAAGGYEAFTQTQTNGIWGTTELATFEPGVATTGQLAGGRFNSVSCASPGNCVAAGSFSNPDGNFEAFTQTQTNGIWANAVPAAFGTGIQGVSPDGHLNSVTCTSEGNCVAVGRFRNAAGGNEAFTQTQTNGSWGSPTPATFGIGVQNSEPNAEFKSVTCVSSGNCVAAGFVKNAAGGQEAFTQTQTNGNWEVAVTATFATGVQSANPSTLFESISCSSVGNCVAAGHFANPSGYQEAFVQVQKDGAWQTATPATFASGVQNLEPWASFHSISCVSDGNCAAVGSFYNPNYENEAFTQDITVVPTSDQSPGDDGTGEVKTLADTGESNSTSSVGLLGIGFLVILIGYIGRTRKG